MSHFECETTCTTYPASRLMWCSESGRPLEIVHDAPFRRADIDTSQNSLWRYKKALVSRGSVHINLGEGWTPLVEDSLDDVRVFWKCEFVSISGSFKDRGISVMMNHLIDNGVKRVAEDSSGNGGASIATYAAAAGIPCRVYVPLDTSPGKIAQIASAGAEVIKIPGTRQAVVEAAMADSAGFFYASHNWHPAFLDGIKTMGFEMWEQLGFEAPDVIVMPAGGGSNVLGCFKAFQELIRAGEIDKMPRLYGVQTANCAPLATAFSRGLETWVEVETRPTLAEGIATSRPVRGHQVLAAARASGGGILAIEDSEIPDSHSRLARRGLYVEPTSAVAYALLSRLIADGTIKKKEKVVVVLTGSGLKSSEMITRMYSAAPSACR